MTNNARVVYRCSQWEVQMVLTGTLRPTGN